MKKFIGSNKTIVALGVALATLLGAGHSVNAQLITYEGFNYPAASTLAGQSGGSGWALNWSIDGSSPANGIIGSSSLSNNVALATNGQSVTFVTSTVYTRQLASTLGTSGSATTRWVGILFLGGTNATPTESRIGFYSGMGEGTVVDGNTTTSSTGTIQVVDVGRPTLANSPADQIALYNGATVRSTGVAVPRGTNAAFLLLKFVMDGSSANDTVSLWVDPDLSLGVGGLGTAQTNWTTANLDLINGLRFQAVSPGTYSIDEIRVGSTFDDVTPQVGPFSVTSSGDPCSGGLTIGVSGSVATDNYWLYTNGVYTGQSVAGTGSAIDFGPKTTGVYTVVATNTVTGRTKLMLGSASVLPPGITSVIPPSSITVVTNITASFSVSAIGFSISYQWYANGVTLANGGQISGAQSSNLVVSLPQAANAASGANGYYCVMQTPCGDITTSSPPASLTLTAPRNLIWAGNNPFSAWDYTADQEFTLSGNPTSFAAGDNATFDDSSSFQTVTVSNNVTSTSVSVVGTKSYTFGGPNKITGVSKLAAGSSGTLTIINDNDFTGGTVVSNGATLNLGNGTSPNGSLAGVVDIGPSGILNYNFGTNGNINNALSGSGTVNYTSFAVGGTHNLAVTAVSSNFTGVLNISNGDRLHANNGSSFPFGNGSTVNVPSFCQAWCDTATFNNVFNIAGNGSPAATPTTGAISVFGAIFTGAINLMADARIGGTISGGTIRSVISGPYRLEVWGTTNSYVLTMGPTNGLPQAYASTLITAGSISAVNSNAISTGPLTLDNGGDMRVNGNNITVASLTSILNGSTPVIQLIEGPRVRNMNATTNGTLTVGTDDSSSQFDGTFSDGAAASFGLTKVGAGTLTLTLLSSNTGPVTVNGGTIALSGSGAFNKAQAIAVATGAILNVSGASGGTLTLNANQTLKHSGASTGPITVTGNVNIGSGTLLLGVNRSGLAHDSLAASGSTTYSGTLAVTNIGAVLQAGDSFQLFPGATVGFGSYNLQTNDYINNVKYAWNNTVDSDGKITVASVTSLVNTSPTNMVVSATSTNITLSWPTDYTGWTLQSQTNALNKGLGTNWADVAGSAATNKVIVPIVGTNGSVFYRMRL